MAKSNKSKELSFSEMVINKIRKKKLLKNRDEIANFLGIKPNTLSVNMYRDSIDVRKVIELCNDIDYNWLFRTDNEYNTFVSNNSQYVNNNSSSSKINDVESIEKGDKLSKNRIEELENQVNSLILQNSTLIELLHQSMTTKKADR